MIDLLGAGPYTVLGLLAGIAVAGLLAWLFPSLADKYVLLALVVGTGFIVGLVLEPRGDGRK
ncbi:hypothetical protein [Variovorax guangxiensis]|uniref:hypothetical protein n=1 Tax=Variovorax guangxiensis TaxID=1775474 RepID=UPI002862CA95|nr:hypothetical protein [Variovorax guangxiensis]MDR6856033.1 putative membrane protein [Variovorax guangxiensis]